MAYSDKEITSIDLLKTLALITMLIDHVGFYFFPDIEMLRVIGRMSFPIWLFLVGFAKSRDIGPRLIIGCIIVQIAGVVAGMDFMPLNILGSILIIRLTLDHVARKMFSKEDELMIGAGVLTILVVPTYLLLEYGTVGWLIALVGYAVRHWDDLAPRLGRLSVVTFCAVAVAVLVASQILSFDLKGVQAFYCALLILVSLGLCYYLSKKGPIKSLNNSPIFIKGALHLFGRRTLEIYVIHQVIFRLLAAYLGTPDFGWFSGGLSPLD